MDWVAFENDRKFVLEGLRHGEVDYVEHVSEAAEADLFRHLVSESLFETQTVNIGVLLLLEGLGHSAQPHGAQFLDGGLYQHGSSLSLIGGLFTGVEVFRAANVGVLEGRLGRGPRLGRLAVKVATPTHFYSQDRTRMER